MDMSDVGMFTMMVLIVIAVLMAMFFAIEFVGVVDTMFRAAVDQKTC